MNLFGKKDPAKDAKTEIDKDEEDLKSKYDHYSSNYSEKNYQEKMKSPGLSKTLKQKAKLLYFLVADKKGLLTPSQKALIYGALGYFILPVDVIPDLLPVGFTDDFAALAAVITLLIKNINDPKKKEILDDYIKQSEEE